MQREFVSWMDLIHAFQKLISMHLLSFNDTGGIRVVVTFPETNTAPANGWLVGRRLFPFGANGLAGAMFSSIYIHFKGHFSGMSPPL